MLLISHVATGAVIGEVVPSLWFAVPLAFASHFLLDMVPHAQAPTEEGYVPNKKTYFWLLLDVLASIVFIYYYKFNLTILLVILVAILPDLLDLTRYNSWFYRVFRTYYDFHDHLQRETNKPIGFVTQVLLIIICIIAIRLIK